MPLEVTRPLPDQPFGYGFHLEAATDWNGPLPQGSYWSVEIFVPVESEEPKWSTIYPTSTTAFNGVHGIFDNGQFIPHAESDMPDGTPARLVVKLVQAPSTIIDQTSVPITIDWKTGMPVLLSNQMQLLEDQAGGFTDADRTTAQATNEAVTPVFAQAGIGLPGVPIDLAQFLVRPPVLALRRDVTLFLTGRGILHYPAGGSEVQAYGAHLSSVSAPSGAGFRDGVILEYSLRIAQFAVYGRHGNVTNFVAELADFDHAGEYFRWDAPFPRRIEYDITPGWTVGWTWLILGIQP